MSANDQYLSKTTIIGQSCRELFVPLAFDGAAPLTRMGVRLAGTSELRQPYIMHRPAQGFHLLYTHSGAGRLWIGEEKHVFSGKELWLIPAGPDVHYELHEESWSISWFHLARCKEWAHLETQTPGPIDPGDSERLPMLMQGLVSEYHVTQAGRVSAGRMYAEILALYLSRVLSCGACAPGSRLRQRIERLWAQVEEAPSMAWTAEEMAARCFLSPTHLFRLCQQYFGYSPMKKVRQIRMNRARMLLQHTDHPLDTIAVMTGYANVYSFSKAFSAESGRSPGAFRSQREV